jgi:hypothetical protein
MYNEEQLAKLEIVIETFQKLHKREPINEDELQIIKDIVCGGVVYNRTFFSDENFWGIINSTTDTIYDNYERLENTLIKCGYSILNGWDYSL